MKAEKAPNYITTIGFAKLQEEFKLLFQQERPRLVEIIAWAASNGDRSENGDYIYGKKRLREIDKRLFFLRQRIESAQVINPSEIYSDKVVFGATVHLLDEDGLQKVYQIVGEDEIEPGKNKVSWKSPLAKSLLGRKEGEEVTVSLPNGKAYYEIQRIEFI